MKNNVNQLSNSECCGCCACIQVCNHDAIKKTIDDRGFEIVEVDKSKCVDCGLCIKTCPILNTPVLSQQKFYCASAYSKKEEVKLAGSSGGLFGVIARDIISKGGVVYGAAFNEDLKLNTERASTIEDLDRLYKSKYILCNTNDAFNRIKKDLIAGIPVMYCSTPCQIAAIKLFLKKHYDNLLLLEFVCHGVGSQYIFDESIKYIEKRDSVTIVNFEFRNKYKKGASSHYFKYDYKDKKDALMSKRGLYLYFPYYNAYCKQWICRDTCYTCKYAMSKRSADITIGDFHTIAKFDASIDRFSGVSMLVCNTEKGYQVIKELESELYIKEYPWNILRDNNRFTKRENNPGGNKMFFDYYKRYGLIKTFSTILNPWKNWKNIIYYSLPEWLRKFIIKYS